MDFGGVDVSAEAAAATSYRTYSDVELLRKRRIEAEGAAAARKTLQCLRVGENESKKRARDHVSLRGWLIAARNWKSMGSCGDAGESLGVLAVDAQDCFIVSIDMIEGGSNDLQVLSSSPATLLLSSSESPESLGGDDLDWTDREIPDVDDEHDFGGVDAGEAADLGLLYDARKKKGLWPTRSYELTRRFHTVWSAVWTWSEGVLADDGLLHQVRCLVCSGVGKKDFVMMPKRSTLEKHDQSIKTSR